MTLARAEQAQITQEDSIDNWNVESMPNPLDLPISIWHETSCTMEASWEGNIGKAWIVEHVVMGLP